MSKPNSSAKQSKQEHSNAHPPSGPFCNDLEASNCVPKMELNILNAGGLRRTSRRTSSLSPVSTESDNTLVAMPPSMRKGLSHKAEQGGPCPLAAMTATALRAITTKHTRINKARFNMLEIKVILKDQPRPPSPEPNVRTILQRKRAEAKQERAARAKKRGLDRNQEDHEDSAVSPSCYAVTPGAERPRKHSRTPGDDDEYSDFGSTRVPLLQDEDIGSSSATPPLVTKRKFVRWDELLESNAKSLPARNNKLSTTRPDGPSTLAKSALAKDPSFYGLGIFGNVITEEPLNNILTKCHVVVTKVVYNDDVD
ncbi:hypothetical protein BS47DRAFT_1382314 [Hydnum rufescens UP504]|uniref:Uncharacterized protein n=1 Tax=Hydnum rufescens UP504 TaxID=1448309 RepID=A0A9P6AXK8_9AGAM|nr:hypothetical protein BS47DRAFT_1382314 [Hydnum rufescens UP504]